MYNTSFTKLSTLCIMKAKQIIWKLLPVGIYLFFIFIMRIKFPEDYTFKWQLFAFTALVTSVIFSVLIPCNLKEMKKVVNFK